MSRFKTVRLFTIIGCVVAAAVALAGPPVTVADSAPDPANGPYTPPACVPGVPFSDITCTTGFDPWIEQFGLDGITAGCGGGLYCPGTPVTRDQMAVFIEKAMRGTANWPAHTQIVWAVKNPNGSPDFEGSGTALLNAVAAIPTSGNDVPSSSNPWLIKVGPGIFDLNGSGLVLPAYVHLDGAGRQITTITSANQFLYTVQLNPQDRVSNMTIKNTGTGIDTRAVSVNQAYAELHNVYVEALGGTTYNIGIYAISSNLAIFDSSIGGAWGIYTSGNSTHSVQVFNTLFGSATYAVNNAFGYEIDLAYNRVSSALHNTAPGVFKCIGNYNFNLAPVSCP